MTRRAGIALALSTPAVKEAMASIYVSAAQRDLSPNAVLCGEITETLQQVRHCT